MSEELFSAARDGDYDTCDHLLDNGVDVNWKNRMEDGATALIAASKHKHTRIVRLLLYHKASPAKITSEGWTCLHFAAQSGHIPILTHLVDYIEESSVSATAAESLINKRNQDGDTALMLATKRNHSNVVKILLSHGADASITDGDGLSCVHMAALNKDLSTMNVILNHILRPSSPPELKAIINLRSPSGSTPLVFACERSQGEAATVLLQRGAVATLTSNDGRTCLSWAARNGDLPTLNIILDHIFAPSASAGLKILLNHKSVAGGTPLTAACNYKHPEVVRTLLARGADATIAGGKGITCLHIAVRSGHVPTLLALLNCPPLALRVLINQRDNAGLTPLVTACDQKLSEIAKILLARGADVTAIEERTGLTCLHFAARNDDVATLNIVLNHMLSSEISLASFRAMLCQKSSRGETALDIAKHRGNRAIIQRLEFAESEILARVLHEEQQREVVVHRIGYAVSSSVPSNRTSNQRVETPAAALEQRLKCTVCLDKERSYVILPCRHLCLCEGCGILESIRLCPVCRAIVGSKIRIYF